MKQVIRALKRSVWVKKRKKENRFNCRRVLGYSKIPIHKKHVKFDLVTIQYTYCSRSSSQGQKMSRKFTIY